MDYHVEEIQPGVWRVEIVGMIRIIRRGHDMMTFAPWDIFRATATDSGPLRRSSRPSDGSRRAPAFRRKPSSPRDCWSRRHPMSACRAMPHKISVKPGMRTAKPLEASFTRSLDAATP